MAKNPAPGNNPKKEVAELRATIEELAERNRELEETLDAIRSGEVDAIIVSQGEGRQIYTLEGADHPYRALVENIREGALTLSRNGIILYTNRRFADMVMLPPDKVAGTFLTDHVCPESKAEVGDALARITKQACRGRVRIHQGKGSLPVFISMNPLTADEDTKISVVVTDRRKDEERLALQAQMLDAVGDAVIAADTRNRIIYWNNAATKTYGWDPEEAIGRDLVEVATPKISHKEAREIVNQLRKGATWTGEYIVKHRDGHEFPIHASDAPIFDSDGKLIAIIGASHDISEQKRAQLELASRNQELNALNEELTATHEEMQHSYDELAAANEILRVTEEELRTTNEQLTAQQQIVTRERDRVSNLLDIANVMILALDRDLKVTLINRRGCEILGRPEEDILGKDWVSVFVPEGIRREIRKGLLNIIAGTGDFKNNENPVLTRDGGLREILWSNALIRDGTGNATGILSSGEDITERKQAEAALHMSEERYRELAEKAGSIILRFDTAGRITYFNEFAEQFFGYSRDEILGKTALGTIIPEVDSSGRDMTSIVQDIVADPGRYTANENENMRKNGERVWVRWTNRPMFNPDGTIREFTTIGTDATEHHRIELALIESERRFRSVLDNSSDVIYRVDLRTGRYAYISPSSAAVVGYSPRELQELDAGAALAMIHPEDLPEMKAALTRLEETGRASADYRQRAKNGEYRWLSNHMNLIRDESGRPLYRDGTIRDVTRRRQVDDALKESEERYRTLVDSSPDGVLVHRDGVFLYANAAALDLYGAASLADLAGKTVTDLIAPEDRQKIKTRVRQAMSGKPIPLRETVLLKLDGTPVPVETVGGPVLYQGAPAAQIIIRDITVRRDAEDALLKNEKILRDALAEKEILLAEVHHRVKNNLTAFISLLSLDGASEETDTGRALKKDLQNRARSMALIHETLYRTGNFSRVEMDVYLTTLVEQVAASYAGKGDIRTIVDARGVILDLSRATTAGLIVNELITNSFKYAFPPSFDCAAVRSEPATIRVKADRKDGSYRITVSDNGCGLPPDVDPRASKTLGLKLVNFLARHQLRADVSVDKEKGTTFIFMLDPAGGEL